MSSKYKKSFLTGGVGIEILSGEPVGDSGFFPLFLTKESAPADVTVTVIRAALPRPEGSVPFKTDRRMRVISGEKVYDYTSFADASTLGYKPYACAVTKGNSVELYIDYPSPAWDTMLFDALNIPDLLLARGAVIAHASFIRYKGRGVIFAGEKQQGKSTQARLWNEYRGAEIINGDRAALRRDGPFFTAHGIPFCGSSMVCVNAYAPLAAVVFPEKAPENTVRELSAIESFKRLIGCLSYTEEDPVMRDTAIKRAELIASEKRCFLLSCRPDSGAVEVLERELGL